MSKFLAILVTINLALFIWNISETSSYAQRPPEVTPDGVPYLRVNINPTPVPPLVNINPEGEPPRVQVTRMPEVVVPPVGCDSGRNFDTGVSSSVSGPIKISFLSLPQTGQITFVDNANRSYRVTWSTLQLNSAIYLRADQKLEFDSDVMYSGCRP